MARTSPLARPPSPGSPPSALLSPRLTDAAAGDFGSTRRALLLHGSGPRGRAGGARGSGGRGRRPQPFAAGHSLRVSAVRWAAQSPSRGRCRVLPGRWSPPPLSPALYSAVPAREATGSSGRESGVRPQPRGDVLAVMATRAASALTRGRHAWEREVQGPSRARRAKGTRWRCLPSLKALSVSQGVSEVQVKPQAVVGALKQSLCAPLGKGGF